MNSIVIGSCSGIVVDVVICTSVVVVTALDTAVVVETTDEVDDSPVSPATVAPSPPQLHAAGVTTQTTARATP